MGRKPFAYLYDAIEMSLSLPARPTRTRTRLVVAANVVREGGQGNRSMRLNWPGTPQSASNLIEINKFLHDSLRRLLTEGLVIALQVQAICVTPSKHYKSIVLISSIKYEH